MMLFVRVFFLSLSPGRRIVLHFCMRTSAALIDFGRHNRKNRSPHTRNTKILGLLIYVGSKIISVFIKFLKNHWFNNRTLFKSGKVTLHEVFKWQLRFS